MLAIMLSFVASLLNANSGTDWWFFLAGAGLSVLGISVWLRSRHPHWNWIAIIFFSLSALLGVLIYLVHIGVLLPAPPPEPPAVAVAPISIPTEIPPATAAPTETTVPTLRSTAVIEPFVTPPPTDLPEKMVTPAVSQFGTSTAELQATVSPTPTQLVVVPPLVEPTITPTPFEFIDGYIHTVQEDENLACITQNYYGDERYLDTLCQYNQSVDRMGEDCGEFLAVGRRLAIPPASLVTFAFLPPVNLPPHQPDACTLP